MFLSFGAKFNQSAFNNFLLALCEEDKFVSDYTVKKIDCSKVFPNWNNWFEKLSLHFYMTQRV